MPFPFRHNNHQLSISFGPPAGVSNELKFSPLSVFFTSKSMTSGVCQTCFSCTMSFIVVKLKIIIQPDKNIKNWIW